MLGQPAIGWLCKALYTESTNLLEIPLCLDGLSERPKCTHVKEPSEDLEDQSLHSI